jgi:hypothetical protein
MTCIIDIKSIRRPSVKVAALIFSAMLALATFTAG